MATKPAKVLRLSTVLLLCGFSTITILKASADYNSEDWIQRATRLYAQYQQSYEDLIIIDKAFAKLYLFKNGNYTNTYEIALSINQTKQTIYNEWSTPEGDFFVCMKATTNIYHRFLGISYPHYEAAEYGLKNGIISSAQYQHIIHALNNGACPPWNTRLGGALGIHGAKKIALPGISLHLTNNINWTKGCVALNDDDIEELYELTVKGTRVVIMNDKVQRSLKTKDKLFQYFIEKFIF